MPSFWRLAVQSQVSSGAGSKRRWGNPSGGRHPELPLESPHRSLEVIPASGANRLALGRGAQSREGLVQGPFVWVAGTWKRIASALTSWEWTSCALWREPCTRASLGHWCKNLPVLPSTLGVCFWRARAAIGQVCPQAISSGAGQRSSANPQLSYSLWGEGGLPPLPSPPCMLFPTRLPAPKGSCLPLFSTQGT